MRKDAFLVNIARGEVVDQDAMVEALRAGTWPRAGLDVATPEPLPEVTRSAAAQRDHHAAHLGLHAGYLDAVLALFAEQPVRFVSGQPLRNRVDKQLATRPGAGA